MSLLNKDEVAKMIRISAVTLDRLVSRGEGPPVTRVGGRVFFREDKLREWIEAQTRQHVAA